MSDNENYEIDLWRVDPVYSFSFTVPKAYTMRKLVHGMANPKTGEGSLVLGATDSSIVGEESMGYDNRDRDFLIIQAVQSMTGPILPSSYSDSAGCQYTKARMVPLGLQELLKAIGPFSLGIVKGKPVAYEYYLPANTTMDLSNPLFVPRIQQILVYNGPTAGTFMTYVLSARNNDKLLDQDGCGNIDWNLLKNRATEMTKKSYCPYSHFPVGVAALVNDSRIVTGCNVENASYGLTLCAECGLVSELIASGGGKLIAVVCVNEKGDLLSPCGRCRQLLYEHGGADCLIMTPDGPQTILQILPWAFGPNDIN